MGGSHLVNHGNIEEIKESNGEKNFRDVASAHAQKISGSIGLDIYYHKMKQT